MFISIFEGEYVLKKAQAKAIPLTMKNSRSGNTKLGGRSINMLRWKVIVQPTQVPITTPLTELAITKMKAS